MSAKLKSRAGFTLAEVLVSLALTGVLGFSAIEVLGMLSNSTKYNDRSQALAAMASSIREKLVFEEQCNGMLADASGLNKNLDLAAVAAGQQEISVKIPGIASGFDGSGNTLSAGTVVPIDDLKVTSLRLVGVQSVGPGEYVAQILLTASSIDDAAFKPVYVGAVDFVIVGSALDHCRGQTSQMTQTNCSAMGCTWNTTAQTCACANIQDLCGTGFLPIGYANGVPSCAPIGGSPCSPGQYLVSIGIGTSVCTTAPVGGPPPPSGPMCSDGSQPFTVCGPCSNSYNQNSVTIQHDVQMPPGTPMIGGQCSMPDSSLWDFADLCCPAGTHGVSL